VDPTGRHRVRYHDGDEWTEWVADDGAARIDPVGLPEEPGLPRRASVARHEQRFAVAAAVACVALLAAFGAFLSGVDPGPGEDPDEVVLSVVAVTAGICALAAALYAAVELARALSARRRPDEEA
jgi:hypothetical protein